MDKLSYILGHALMIVLYTMVVQISTIHGCGRSQPPSNQDHTVIQLSNAACSDNECSRGSCVQRFDYPIRSDICRTYDHDELRRKRGVDDDEYIYRILRDFELEQIANYQHGLVARDPHAGRSVQSHVGCGSRPGYQSQYISCTADHQSALDWARLARERRNAGPLALVRISRRWLRAWGFNVVDLTDSSVRNTQLTHPISRNCAARYHEVLVEGHIPYAAIDGIWIIDQNGTEIPYNEWQHRNM